MATRDEIIAEELQLDPLNRDYASMTDEQARDDANNEYRTLKQGVWLSDLYQYLIHEVNNPRAGNPASPRTDSCLRMLAELAREGTIQGQTETDPENTGTPRAITSDDIYAAQNVQGFFEKASDTGGQQIFLDFGKAAIRASWDQLVDVGVIDATQRLEIETLSDVPQSRAAEVGAPNWTTFEVQKNRP